MLAALSGSLVRNAARVLVRQSDPPGVQSGAGMLPLPAASVLCAVSRSGVDAAAASIRRVFGCYYFHPNSGRSSVIGLTCFAVGVRRVRFCALCLPCISCLP